MTNDDNWICLYLGIVIGICGENFVCLWLYLNRLRKIQQGNL